MNLGLDSTHLKIRYNCPPPSIYFELCATFKGRMAANWAESNDFTVRNGPVE